MTNEVENQVLEHLRAIRANELSRITSLEDNMAAIKRRLDALEADVHIFEKRLELVEDYAAAHREFAVG